MDAFRFSPVLFELRTQVMEALGEAGFQWPSHFSAVDPIHDLYGIEVCGIADQDDAIAIQRLLCEMFPGWHIGCLCYKDYGAEPGFKAQVFRDQRRARECWEDNEPDEQPQSPSPAAFILGGAGILAFSILCLAVSLAAPVEEFAYPWIHGLLIGVQALLGSVIVATALIVKGIDIWMWWKMPKELAFLRKHQSALLDRYCSRRRHFATACSLMASVLFLYPALHFWFGL